MDTNIKNGKLKIYLFGFSEDSVLYYTIFVDIIDNPREDPLLQEILQAKTDHSTKLDKSEAVHNSYSQEDPKPRTAEPYQTP